MGHDAASRTARIGWVSMQCSNLQIACGVVSQSGFGSVHRL
jgi:hypothetical protein